MMKIFTSKSFKKLLSAILLWLMITPCLVSATIAPYPTYNWTRIILFSLLAFLVLFLIWITSPLGVIFILSSLVQFLITKKVIRIIAWAFQGLVFIFSILLGIAGFIYTFSLYGEQKYIFLFSLIGTVIVISCLMVGVIIAQIVWQGKRQK